MVGPSRCKTRGIEGDWEVNAARARDRHSLGPLLPSLRRKVRRLSCYTPFFLPRARLHRGLVQPAAQTFIRRPRVADQLRTVPGGYSVRPRSTPPLRGGSFSLPTARGGVNTPILTLPLKGVSSNGALRAVSCRGLNGRSAVASPPDRSVEPRSRDAASGCYGLRCSDDTKTPASGCGRSSRPQGGRSLRADGDAHRDFRPSPPVPASCRRRTWRRAWRAGRKSPGALGARVARPVGPGPSERGVQDPSAASRCGTPQKAAAMSAMANSTPVTVQPRPGTQSVTRNPPPIRSPTGRSRCSMCKPA